MHGESLAFILFAILSAIQTGKADEQQDVCYICNGDPTANITIPEAVIDLTILGLPGETITCLELFRFGTEGLLFADECAAILAEPTIATTCGCTAVAAPIAPTPVATAAPIPLLPTIATQAPITAAPVLTPAPVIAPVTLPPTFAPITPAPILTTAAPVTPAPVLTTAAPVLVTPAPIVPTTQAPAIGLPTGAPSRRAPTAESQRVPVLPENRISRTRAVTRPTLRPNQAKPVRIPRDSRNRNQNNPTKHPRPKNINSENIKETSFVLPPSIPVSVQINDPTNDVIEESESTTIELKEVVPYGDLPALLVSLDYTNTYKRQALLQQKLWS